MFSRQRGENSTGGHLQAGGYSGRFQLLSDEAADGEQWITHKGKRRRRSTGGTGSFNPNMPGLNTDSVPRLTEREFKELPTDDKLVTLFNLMTNVNTFDTRMNSVEKNVKGMCGVLDAHEAKIRLLEYRSIDAEARSRRNNLIFRGIAETPGDDDMCAGIIKGFIRKELSLELDPCIQRAHRLGNPNARKRFSRRPAQRPTPRPIIVCFRDYADVETIIGNAYKLANTNLGISRDYPKEIVDARSELWPLYKSERQKYSKSNVFIRFPAQLVVNGRIAADKFPDWRSVLNGSRNKLSNDDDQTRAGRSTSRTGPSSSRPRNEREVSRDSARSETDDDTREVAMQMDSDQRSQASGSGSDLTASSNRGPRSTDIQSKTVYDEAMGRLMDHFDTIRSSQQPSSSKERSSSVPPSRDRLNELNQIPEGPTDQPDPNAFH